jgi:hypothetical protein
VHEQPNHGLELHSHCRTKFCRMSSIQINVLKHKSKLVKKKCEGWKRQCGMRDRESCTSLLTEIHRYKTLNQHISPEVGRLPKLPPFTSLHPLLYLPSMIQWRQQMMSLRPLTPREILDRDESSINQNVVSYSN